MGGHPGAAEDIGDQDVRRVRWRLFEPAAGVGAVHADPRPLGQRQMLGDQRQQSAVRLRHVLPRTRPGGGDVAGQGECPAAEVDHVEGRAGSGGTVQYVGQAPYVLELQVRRIVQVDVRLRGLVDREQPGPVAVDVGQQSGGAVIDVADDGYGLVHSPIVRCRILLPARVGPEEDPPSVRAAR